MSKDIIKILKENKNLECLTIDKITISITTIEDDIFTERIMNYNFYETGAVIQLVFDDSFYNLPGGSLVFGQKQGVNYIKYNPISSKRKLRKLTNQRPQNGYFSDMSDEEWSDFLKNYSQKIDLLRTTIGNYREVN